MYGVLGKQADNIKLQEPLARFATSDGLLNREIGNENKPAQKLPKFYTSSSSTFDAIEAISPK